MKELNRFYAQNKNQINAIEKTHQSAHKGGRLTLSSSIFGFRFPSLRSSTKIDRLTKPKIFTSFADFRSYMMGGK